MQYYKTWEIEYIGYIFSEVKDVNAAGNKKKIKEALTKTPYLQKQDKTKFYTIISTASPS